MSPWARLCPMDAHGKSGIVDWTQLGRRLRRPLVWLVLLAALAGTAAGAMARPLLDDHPAETERRFRFDEVYVVEESVAGNFTRIRIVPWVSNPSHDGTRTLQLVMHVIGPRNLVQNVTRLEPLAPGARKTVTTAASFTVNNTQSFRIEILALVDGLLVAKGYGSIGFQQFEAFDQDAEMPTLRASLTSDGFHYEYREP